MAPGYPDGLKGEAIPLGARVLAVVDYYDALTANRPYHRAMGQEEAIETLRLEAGKALDPRLIELFMEVLLLTEDHEYEGAREPVLPESSSAPRTGAPATGFSTSSESPIRGRGDGVSEHLAGHTGSACALRHRADARHPPQRGRHDGPAHLEGQSPRAGVLLGSLSARRTPGRVAVPVCGRPLVRRARRAAHSRSARA